MGPHHGHHHHHDEVEIGGSDLPAALDLSTPDEELRPEDRSRRSFLRRAGLLGAGVAAAGAFAGAGAGAAPAAAHGKDEDKKDNGDFKWLAGDHHIHTHYSDDGLYRVIDQVQHGRAYGLDWMVITDHGSNAHAKIGVDKVNPEILAAREALKDTLIFQGLEWNIPGAEHGTVFVHPGRNELSVLKKFENDYDANVNGTGASTPANEALAIAGLNFLSDQVKRGKVEHALFLANHPARNGIDSPHEIRNWRDAAPGIAIGMEGAPGHQAGGISKDNGGPGAFRGSYGNSPSANSFPYPLESYRTWGGFDWFTSTVGGLWDSLLAEGKAWWITANSDAHTVFLETAVRGNKDFNELGYWADPVHGGKVTSSYVDFFPGYYSRTHVGAKTDSYLAVMDGLRLGRVFVDHGGLIAGLDMRVRKAGDRDGGTPLGGTLSVKKGTALELVVSVDLATLPNWASFIPRLARVDVIRGKVTGKPADKDAFTAPNTRVEKSFEVGTGQKKATFTYNLGRVDHSYYVRVRGTDGNRQSPGYLGASADPHGPSIDVQGATDPWTDLWFYTNPIFVEAR
ncbi:PHP domain-containing protein [Asanoa siamensis]|uniref:Histidinol-phosphatase n=1 Tax=Asanoa siamensis TaxID=926357 RepID=A0ABQ4CV91_9ACTN|nr:PHP domain-containing protein [Asanoa siamensis]GIF75190.1 histidinol-phosphatase [Asanoa siamensis]